MIKKTFEQVVNNFVYQLVLRGQQIDFISISEQVVELKFFGAVATLTASNKFLLHNNIGGPGTIEFRQFLFDHFVFVCHFIQEDKNAGIVTEAR